MLTASFYLFGFSFSFFVSFSLINVVISVEKQSILLIET